MPTRADPGRSGGFGQLISPLMPSTHSDILIIGGGVVGLTTALKLAERGRSVTLLDHQNTGQEASWAGAGMLPPGNLQNAVTPEARLRSYSHSLWKDFSANLLDRTGIDNGFHVCGAVEILSPLTALEVDVYLQTWTQEGIEVQRLSPAEAQQFVPGLNPRLHEIGYVPQFAQVRNPRHLHAVRAASLQQGVAIIENARAICFEQNNERATAVISGDHRFTFEQLCITAGAWSTSILQKLGFTAPVKPVRGQMVQLQLPDQPFPCVIEQGRRYLVPRRDGLILIGSTEEDAGFQKETTPEGVAGLLEFASQLVPSLANAPVARTWAGLRPGSPDELPLLGVVPGFSNLYVGAGHFRSGLQMSPATATILADLMLGIAPAIALDGLQADRFQSS